MKLKQIIVCATLIVSSSSFAAYLTSLPETPVSPDSYLMDDECSFDPRCPIIED